MGISTINVSSLNTFKQSAQPALTRWSVAVDSHLCMLFQHPLHCIGHLLWMDASDAWFTSDEAYRAFMSQKMVAKKWWPKNDGFADHYPY